MSMGPSGARWTPRCRVLSRPDSHHYRGSLRPCITTPITPRTTRDIPPNPPPLHPPGDGPSSEHRDFDLPGELGQAFGADHESFAARGSEPRAREPRRLGGDDRVPRARPGNTVDADLAPARARGGRRPLVGLKPGLAR